MLFPIERILKMTWSVRGALGASVHDDSFTGSFWAFGRHLPPHGSPWRWQSPCPATHTPTLYMLRPKSSGQLVGERRQEPPGGDLATCVGCAACERDRGWQHCSEEEEL